MSGQAVPSFWLGIMLIVVFALWLGWLPPSGYTPPGVSLSTNLSMMLLPAIALGVEQAAVVMRQVRSALIDVLHQEYITTAWAKGLPERVVVNRHALKNALIPVVTIIGLQTGRLFGGCGRGGDDLRDARPRAARRRLDLLPRFPVAPGCRVGPGAGGVPQ